MNLRKSVKVFVIYLLTTFAVFVNAVYGERIKDIVDIQGVRSNPIQGVGLVIGLSGTGDSSILSRQMLTSILRDSGIVLTPSDLTGGNIAVVMVTTELGPFDHQGSRIDVDVSTIGDAKS